MFFTVPSTIEVFMDKIALWISIRANDWTAERVIITSNEWTVGKITISNHYICFGYS